MLLSKLYYYEELITTITSSSPCMNNSTLYTSKIYLPGTLEFNKSWLRTSCFQLFLFPLSAIMARLRKLHEAQTHLSVRKGGTSAGTCFNKQVKASFHGVKGSRGVLCQQLCVHVLCCTPWQVGTRMGQAGPQWSRTCPAPQKNGLLTRALAPAARTLCLTSHSLQT